jgi:hypothetical protein
VAVNGSYDLEVEFTRSDGDCDVNTIFTAGSQQCSMLLSMAHGVSGLDRIDGKRPTDEGNPTTIRPGTLVNGHRYRLLISVRIPQPEHASVNVSLDGKPYLPHWEGNPASLSLEAGWRMPDVQQLGLAAWSTRVTFHSMRLRLVAGRAISKTAALEIKSEVDLPSRSSGKKKQIDLLKLVDLKRDGVSRNWQRNGEDIWCDAAEGARLAFPYLPPKEYDFEVVFTRVSGHDYVGQLCVGGGRQFLWGMSGHRRGKVSAFELLDGQDGRSNPTHKEFNIANGQRYTSIVKVRRGQVEAWVDGKLIDAWTTDYHDLEVPAAWVLPDPRRLGIGAWNSLLTVHSAKVTEITGTGKVLFPPIPDSPAKPATAVKSAAGSPSAFPRGQWVDLLRLVDSTTDAVRGTWSRERGEISCKPEECARIKLPVIIDGGYDVEVEFTRTEGNGDVNLLLPVLKNGCVVMLGADKGKYSGLDRVDGLGIGDPKSPCAIRPGTLENGRRYKLLTSVRLAKDGTASIDASLNGKPYLPHWQGKPASLSVSPCWMLPTAGQPGLGVFRSGATFHSARLRMISGEAISESDSNKR